VELEESPPIVNSVAIAEEGFHSNQTGGALLLALVASVLFVAIVILTSGNVTGLILLPLLATLVFIVADFNAALVCLVGSLFVNVWFGYSSAVLCTIPLTMAFLIHRPRFRWDELAHPLVPSLAIYALCILPSFLNAVQPVVSLIRLFNVVGFVVTISVLVASLRNRRMIALMAYVFFTLTVLNSVHVWFEAFDGIRRPTGFAGVMFVDYSALAVCVAATLGLVTRGRTRKTSYIVAAISGIGMIFTQTRNTWLSALITLGILGIYLLRRPEIIGKSRSSLTRTGVAALAVTAMVVLGAMALNPRSGERAAELADTKGYEIDELGYTQNSLVSRMLIWDTALNAFKAHPFIGIGVYAFPYSSELYSRMPKLLYVRYVKFLSPHQTHLEVIAETGILGLCGFLFFIASLLKIAFRTIDLAEGDNKPIALVTAVGVLYCVVSMVFTDAWMIGQGIILFGILVGIMLAHRRMALEARSGDVNVNG
jgi:O-antigen ligase